MNHETFDYPIEIRFLFSVRPRRSDVLIDTLRVVGLFIVADLEGIVGVRQPSICSIEAAKERDACRRKGKESSKRAS